MSVIERFLQLNLPPSECVVIGSGILDALDLRASRDIDIVASADLFDRLRTSAEWHTTVVHGELKLQKGDAEVWQSWGSAGVPNFDILSASGMTIGGVQFASPGFVITQKRERGQPKDTQDITLLERYEAHE